MITIDDVGDASRLVSLGMRPKLLPSRDVVYGDLVRRYSEDPDFADLVQAVADGLGLIVLAVSPRTGAVLAAAGDSAFEIKIDDYARRASFRDRRDTEKALHGVIHLAIAALAFPRPADLADDTYVGRVSVEQVDAVVREACRVLDERAAAAEENNDPLDDAPDLERVWRIYARRAAVAGTKDGRLGADTTHGMVSKAMRFLSEQGFLTAVSDADGVYRTTPRYSVQVRELAAERAFAELLDLGVVTVSDGSGSLHAVAAEVL